MSRFLILLYGVVSYIVFLLSFVYAIGFVGDFLVPKTINSGSAAPLGEALFINLGLLMLFVVQHTIMARPGFKRVFTRIIPKAAERSTFVLLSSLILLLIFWQWRPLPTPVWTVESEAVRMVVWAIFGFGWFMVLTSTFIINHFDLFGLRQVWLHFTKQEYTPPDFQVTWYYRFVRHPLMLGFVIAFWATPAMTTGHLVFAIATTGYMLMGMWFEERDLIAYHGRHYLEYRKRVAALVPFVKGVDKKQEPIPGSATTVEEVAK